MKTLVLTTALVAVGCSGSESNSIVVVTVTAGPGIPTVTQLRVVVTNAGLSDTKVFPKTPVREGITFDTSFAVTFPTSRAGYLMVTVTALDPSGREVAGGSNTAQIVPGGRADVSVTLVPVVNPDAGVPGPDVPGADAPGPELGKADGPVGPDVIQVRPDVRGSGGIGGTTGAGGTTSTGGVTTLPPTGSGGVTSTGGTTARPTGGVTGSGGIGTARTTSTGGKTTGSGGAGGTAPVGTGGRTGTGGVLGTGGATGTDPGSEPCTPARTITGTGSGTAGNFGTTGPYCFRTPDNISGWGCSNFTGRTVKVNGVEKDCGAMPLPAKINGYYYFDCSGGTGAVDYASIFWY
jgi:hypothetical protein